MIGASHGSVVDVVDVDDASVVVDDVVEVVEVVDVDGASVVVDVVDVDGA